MCGSFISARRISRYFMEISTARFDFRMHEQRIESFLSNGKQHSRTAALNDSRYLCPILRPLSATGEFWTLLRRYITFATRRTTRIFILLVSFKQIYTHAAFCVYHVISGVVYWRDSSRIQKTMCGAIYRPGASDRASVHLFGTTPH